MPIIKPSLNKINAFDANEGTTLSFSWTGGQAQKNRIVIRDYETQEVVYDCTQTTMALKHTLHLTADSSSDTFNQAQSYKLQNGHRYSAVVYVICMVGSVETQSISSNEVLFYCLATPRFEFTNFTNFDYSTHIAKIAYNSVYLNVAYNQVDGETINEYNFALYDYSGHLLLQSATFYGSTANDNLQYTIGGITDTEKDSAGNLNFNTYYRIVCSAVTIHGMSISTEQKFVVQKDTGGVGALVTVEKLPDNNVSISSHFKIVNSDIDGEEKYVNNAVGNPFAIDLTKGQNLSFLEGFNMNSPWSITGIFSACNENTTLLTCENPSGEKFTVSYIVKKYPLSKKAFFLFKSVRKNTHYLIRTDYMPISDKWYILYLRYENGYYTFRAYDPYELGYQIPDYDEYDYVLSDPNNIYATKNTVKANTLTVGTTTLPFSASINLGDKYTFKKGTNYEIIFDVKNIVKNNYVEMQLEEAKELTIQSNVYFTYNAGTVKANFVASDSVPAPTFDFSWANVCKVTKIEDYFNSSSYCVVQNLVVKDVVDCLKYDVLLKKDITSSETGGSTVNSSVLLNLSPKFSFSPNCKYQITYDVETMVYNSKGVKINGTSGLTSALGSISVEGNSAKFLFNATEDNVIPSPISISWTNNVTISDKSDAALVYVVIRNLKVINTAHLNMLTEYRTGEIYTNDLIGLL